RRGVGAPSFPTRRSSDLRELAELPGVRSAVAPAGPAWRHGGTALIGVQPAAEPSAAAGAAAIARIRTAVTRVPGATVGGPGPLLDRKSTRLNSSHVALSQ